MPPAGNAIGSGCPHLQYEWHADPLLFQIPVQHMERWCLSQAWAATKCSSRTRQGRLAVFSPGLPTCSARLEHCQRLFTNPPPVAGRRAWRFLAALSEDTINLVRRYPNLGAAYLYRLNFPVVPQLRIAWLPAATFRAWPSAAMAGRSNRRWLLALLKRISGTKFRLSVTRRMTRKYF